MDQFCVWFSYIFHENLGISCMVWWSNNKFLDIIDMHYQTQICALSRRQLHINEVVSIRQWLDYIQYCEVYFCLSSIHWWNCMMLLGANSRNSLETNYFKASYFVTCIIIFIWIAICNFFVLFWSIVINLIVVVIFSSMSGLVDFEKAVMSNLYSNFVMIADMFPTGT